MMLLLLFKSTSAYPLPNFNEYQVESVFIYQFTNFIEWPTETAVNTDSPFVISILGDSPIVQELQKFCNNKTVKGKPIEIKSISADALTPFELENSKIIVVTSKNESVLRNIIKQTSGRPILIISRARGFGEKGSMINFFLDQDKVKFEINRKVLNSAKLTVNSRLLYIAKLIE